jgi:ABC-type branched-subunit amino acid transport system substrate-binding protein
MLFSVGCSAVPDYLVIGHLNPRDDLREYQILKASVEELNASPANRPAGRKVQIRHADVGNSLTELQAQSVRLASVNRSLVLIGGHRSEEASVIGQAAQADSILAFSGAGHPGAIPNPYLFCLGVSPARQAKALADFAESHGKRLLLVTSKKTPEAYPAAIRTATKNRSKLILQETVLTEDAASQTGLATLLTQTDLLVLCLPPSDRNLLKEDLLKPESLTIFLAGEEIDALPLKLSNRQLMLRSYLNEPIRPMSLPAAQMQDAFMVAHQLLGRVGSLDPTKLRAELLNPEPTLQSLTGKVRFLEDGTCERRQWLVEWKNGKWESVRVSDQ